MLQAFAGLRRKLRQGEVIPMAECLAPFLAVVRPETNSTVVASGLGSLAKLLRSGFFRIMCSKLKV